MFVCVYVCLSLCVWKWLRGATVEELGEHRTTNYISKNKNFINSNILVCEDQIYVELSQYKPSLALQLLAFDPPVLTGINICNSWKGNEVNKVWEPRFLLKRKKLVLDEIYWNHDRNNCSLLISSSFHSWLVLLPFSCIVANPSPGSLASAYSTGSPERSYLLCCVCLV